jgi:hypothetical protein
MGPQRFAGCTEFRKTELVLFAAAKVIPTAIGSLAGADSPWR